MSIGSNARFYEDFSLGEAWKTGGRTITEQDISTFADFSGDHNPIHTDEIFARNTVFGARILHGAAGFAIATGLESELGLKAGTAIAFLGMDWNMVGPIRIGDSLHVEQRVAALRETRAADRGIVTFAVALRNQHDEVVQAGDWTIMIQRRP